MNEQSDNFQEKSVRTFYLQKFEALGISIFALILLFQECKAPEGLKISLLFSHNAMPYLITFLISISSWHFNLRTESTLAFKTDYCVSYATHAAIQDFDMFFCVVVFALCALFHLVSIWWFIAYCIILILLLIWKFKVAYRIIKWAANLTIFNILPPEATATEYTTSNLLSSIIRYLAPFYAIYYIFK